MRHLTFLLLAVISVMPSTARAEVRYQVTNMTEVWIEAIALPDEVTSIGGGMLNNNGQIAGTYKTVAGGRHAFIWDPDSGLKDLGNLGQDNFTTAYAINNNGKVVGESKLDVISSGDGHAFLWDDANGMHDLGSFGSLSYATGINDHGNVVGASWYDENTGNDYSHAFLWTEEAGMLPIGVEGELYSNARDINNVGQIIGLIEMPGEIAQSVMWDSDGSIHYLETGIEFQTTDINDNGLIVGRANNTDATLLTWSKEDGFRDLGTIDGGKVVGAQCNNSSQIVGRLRVLDQDGLPVRRAFLWEESTGMQYLDDLISTEAPWAITDAFQVNDDGLIIARHYYDDGSHATLLLTPVPEPSVVILLLTIMLYIGLYVIHDKYSGREKKPTRNIKERQKRDILLFSEEAERPFFV